MPKVVIDFYFLVQNFITDVLLKKTDSIRTNLDG